jgi:hypothetical protein
MNHVNQLDRIQLGVRPDTNRFLCTNQCAIKGPFTQAKISTYLSSRWLFRQKKIYNLYLKNGPARA